MRNIFTFKLVYREKKQTEVSVCYCEISKFLFVKCRAFMHRRLLSAHGYRDLSRVVLDISFCMLHPAVLKNSLHVYSIPSNNSYTKYVMFFIRFLLYCWKMFCINLIRFFLSFTYASFCHESECLWENYSLKCENNFFLFFLLIMFVKKGTKLTKFLLLKQPFNFN